MDSPQPGFKEMILTPLQEALHPLLHPLSFPKYLLSMTRVWAWWW